MKTTFKTFVSIAVAAFTLAACAPKETPEVINNDELITLKFNIRNADDATVTKALLGTENGKNFLNWENEDLIGTYSEGSFTSGNSTYSTSNNNSGAVDVEGDDFTLNVRVYNPGTITKIYSYFPYSPAAGSDKTKASISIPESQYMSGSGFDADAMPMAGTPVTVNLSAAANTQTPCGDINFSNLGSIINFKVYSSVDTDETLTSVKYVSSNAYIGGSYTVDLTAIDGTNESTLALIGNGSLSEITTYHHSNPSIGTGKENAIDVYMVVAPGSYTGTQVVITTNVRTYTLTASGEKNYVRSHVKPMYVDIQKGTQGDLPVAENWVKVTNVSDFTAGTYYILNWDEKSYLPNNESGNAPAAKKFEGTISSDMKWEATTSNGGLIFKNPSEELYLWGQDGTNNGVRVKKDAPADNSAKVWMFSSDSDFNVIASVGSNRYLATYNNAGTQQDWRNYQRSSIGDGTNVNSQGNVTTSVNNFPAVFFKLQDNRNESNIEWSASTGTADVKSGVSPSLPTLSNPNSLTVSYSSSDPTIATVDEDEHIITALKEGTTQIHAIFEGDSSYKPCDVYYTLTVNDTREVVATPIFSEEEGAVAEGTTVSISCSTSGATIHYTIDGSEPSESSTIYSSAIAINAATTIKAIAFKDGYKPSAIAKAEYTIQGSFAPVSFSWTQASTTTGYAFTMVLGSSKTGYIQDKSSSEGLDLVIKKSDASALFSTIPSEISVTVKVGGGSAKDPLTNNVMAYLLDADGNNIASTATTVTTKVENKEGKEYTVSIPLVTSAYGLRISHEKEPSYNIRIYSISFSAN